MTRATVPVALGDRSYDIHIGPTVLAEAGALMAPLLRRKHTIIVTDETVAGLHLETLTASLDRAGIGHEAIVLPPGEGTKSVDQLSALLDRIFAIGIERGRH